MDSALIIGVILALIVGMMSQVHGGVLYCSPGAEAGKACSQEEPCRYQDAWGKITEELNIIQLLDGQYDEEGSFEIDGIDGLVTVMGSENVNIASLPTIKPKRDGFQIKIHNAKFSELKQPLIDNTAGQSGLRVQLSQLEATGGQYPTGSLPKFQAVTITNCHFKDFKIPLMMGSKIPKYWEADQALTIEGSEFNNFAGVYAYELSTIQAKTSTFTQSQEGCLKVFGGDVTLQSATFTKCLDNRPTEGNYENLQPQGRGGAVYFSQSSQKPLSSISLIDTKVKECEAIFGGGLFLNFMNHASGSLKLEKSTSITGNTALYGGGLFFWGMVPPQDLPDDMIKENNVRKHGYGPQAGSNAEQIHLERADKVISVSPNEDFEIKGTIQDAFENQIPVSRKDLFESLVVKSLATHRFKVHTIPILHDLNDYSFVLQDVEVIGQLESNGTVAVLTNVASYRGEVVERIYVAQGTVDIELTACRVGYDLKKLDDDIGTDFFKCKLHPVPTYIYVISFVIGTIGLFFITVLQVYGFGKLNLNKILSGILKKKKEKEGSAYANL